MEQNLLQQNTKNINKEHSTHFHSLILINTTNLNTKPNKEYQQILSTKNI